MTEEAIKQIEAILKRGNTCEVKKVYGNIQVIEIQRQVKYKQNNNSAPV